MEIERIEEWVGQEVVDPEGEKLGKLEDVLFGAGSRDAVAAAVQSGLLGRKHYLVPLQGATVSRASVRVPFTKDQLKDAPQIDAGADVHDSERDAAGRHFGLDLSGSGSLESGSARAQREAEAQAAKERAVELEEVAMDKAAQAREQEKLAAMSRDEADRAERERAEALAKVTGGTTSPAGDEPDRN